MGAAVFDEWAFVVVVNLLHRTTTPMRQPQLKLPIAQGEAGTTQHNANIKLIA